MSSWSCPHEVNGVCQKVRGALCDPGMLGCVVQGKVERIGQPNTPRRPVRAPVDHTGPSKGGDPSQQ